MENTKTLSYSRITNPLFHASDGIVADSSQISISGVIDRTGKTITYNTTLSDILNQLQINVETIERKIDENEGSGVQPIQPETVNEVPVELEIVCAVRGNSSSDYQSSNIVLRWNGSSSAKYYVVYSKNIQTGTYTKIATGVKELTYTDSTAKELGKTYQYAVTYFNNDGEESEKQDSNRITWNKIDSGVNYLGYFTAYYNASENKVQFSFDTSTSGSGGYDVTHYYVFKNGKLIGEMRKNGVYAIFSDSNIEPGQTYEYQFIGVSDYGIYRMNSSSTTMTIPGNDVELDVTIDGEYKIGDTYYIWNNARSIYESTNNNDWNNTQNHYVVRPKAICSDVTKLNQIEHLKVVRYTGGGTPYDERTCLAQDMTLSQGDTIRGGKIEYNASAPNDFMHIAVHTFINGVELIKDKYYKFVDPIIYCWYQADANIGNTNPSSTDFVTDNSEYVNGILKTQNITVNQAVLGKAFELGTVVNDVTDMEIDRKEFGEHLYAGFRRKPNLRLIIFVPQRNDVASRYMKFQLKTDNSQTMSYVNQLNESRGNDMGGTYVPFFELTGNDGYDRTVVRADNSRVSDLYNVYISQIKYSDSDTGTNIENGDFVVVGYKNETTA